MITFLEAIGWIAWGAAYAFFILLLARFMGSNNRNNWRP